jgi:hypothetical protein
MKRMSRFTPCWEAFVNKAMSIFRVTETGRVPTAMTVLTIRAHKRYATRQTVRLAAPGSKAVDGLLIELSSEGCRISNLGAASFMVGQEVTLDIGDDAYHGRIRWSHDGIAGVRLDRALHTYQVAELLAVSRGGEPERRYGT